MKGIIYWKVANGYTSHGNPVPMDVALYVKKIASIRNPLIKHWVIPI